MHSNTETFSQQVIDWYHNYGRKNLPWQKNHNAYSIWISEIMLQQTQVTTVIPYYEKFLHRFPTLSILAQAKEDEVLYYWSGLGYYARARNLLKTASIIHTQYQGEFPKDIDTLISLPGIGRSTAAAILSFAFHLPYTILDGNVKRIIARHQGIEGHYSIKKIEKKYWDSAISLAPKKQLHLYNQALMDIGSSICIRQKPSCAICPIHHDCYAYQENKIPLYPTKKAKKIKPMKQAHFIILLYHREILLIRRTQKNLWGGLWCLPELQEIALPSTSQYQKEPFIHFTHQFTHFTLQIETTLFTIKEKKHTIGKWFSIDHIEDIGLPTPMLKIISHLQTLAN